MKARIEYGRGKINRIDVTIECDNYIALVKEAYSVLYSYPTKWVDLDNELNSWYELAAELQPSLIELDYFGFDEVVFTEESAKWFLNRRDGANNEFGFHYSIIE